MTDAEAEIAEVVRLIDAWLTCTDENEGDANADLEAFADRHRVRDD